MDISRRAALAQTFLAGFVNLLLARLYPAHAQNASYTYDALGRLTGVTYPNGAAVTYTYDAAGNRTQVTHTPGTSPPPPPPPPLSNGTVVFDSSTPGDWSWIAGTTQNYEIKIWGPGAGGTGLWAFYDEKMQLHVYPGGGGGGGGYCAREFSVTINDTLGGRIGAGGAGSPGETGGSGAAGNEPTTLATYQSVAMSAGAGSYIGGSASGGTTNTSGRNPSLTNVTDGGGAGNGGGDQTTVGGQGTVPGGGGAGGSWGNGDGGNGRNGRVLITAR